MKVKVSTKYTVVRDGGSHIYNVLNSDECGFCFLKQDFGIHSKTRGQWFLTYNPPNHTNDKHIPAGIENIEFV